MSKLVAVEMDTPCPCILLVVKGKTPCTSILVAVERDTPVHSAGCGNEYTLYVSTTGALQVHTAGVGGTERDIQCMSKLQVVERDKPCNLASP
jgi:hypothetical protein